MALNVRLPVYLSTELLQEKFFNGMFDIFFFKVIRHDER